MGLTAEQARKYTSAYAHGYLKDFSPQWRFTFHGAYGLRRTAEELVMLAGFVKEEVK